MGCFLEKGLGFDKLSLNGREMVSNYGWRLKPAFHRDLYAITMLSSIFTARLPMP
jgi:hypothetical protein